VDRSLKGMLMFSKLRRLIVSLCMSVFVLSVLPAQNIEDPSWSGVADAIRPRIQQSMTESGIKGLMIVLVNKEKTVWSEGFGVSDIGTNKQVDADTMFEIGSVSKTFSGLMVMQLYEQGKLDIDKPLVTYIPEFKLLPPMGDFPRVERPITVRDVLTHHSGIPGDLMNGAFGTSYDKSYLDTLLAWLTNDSATYPPGYRWAYSNTAVALLERVIENASGKPFAEYSQGFLDSLGMAPASYFRENPDLLNRLSKAYVGDVDIGMLQLNVPSSGSIAASANQMGHYLRMLLNEGTLDGKVIVRPETFRMMVQVQNADNALDLTRKMGLSFVLDDAELEWAGPLLWHNGETTAFTSHLEALRNHDVAVFVSVNTKDENHVAGDIAHATLESALAIKRGLARPEQPGADVSLKAISLPQAFLETLSGNYAGDDLGQIQVLRPQNGGLCWDQLEIGSAGDIERNNQGTLTLWSDGFFRTSAGADIAFEFREIGGRFLMIGHTGGTQRIFRDRFAARPLSDAWKARVGEWVSVDKPLIEAGQRFGAVPEVQLTIVDGILVMERSGQLLVVEPVSDEVGYIRGLGRIGGSALRFQGRDVQNDVQSDVQGSDIQTRDGDQELRFMMDVFRFNADANSK